MPAIGIFFGLAALSAGLAFTAGMSRRPKAGLLFATMITSTLCFASTASLFGPLVLMPGLVAANTTGYVILLSGRMRLLSIGFACLAIYSLVVLDVLGIPWSSYSFSEAGMVIHPGAIGLSAGPTLVLLCLAAATTILTTTLAVSRVRGNLARAEVQLSLQAWQIRQLAPAVSGAGVLDAAVAERSRSRPGRKRRR